LELFQMFFADRVSGSWPKPLAQRASPQSLWPRRLDFGEQMTGQFDHVWSWNFEFADFLPIRSSPIGPIQTQTRLLGINHPSWRASGDGSALANLNVDASWFA
jgi:hypothetical protein